MYQIKSRRKTALLIRIVVSSFNDKESIGIILDDIRDTNVQVMIPQRLIGPRPCGCGNKLKTSRVYITL